MSQLPAYTSIEEGPPPEYDIDYKYSFETPEKPKQAEEFEEAFAIETPRYNDTLFTWLFIGSIAGLVLLTVNSWHVIANSNFNSNSVAEDTSFTMAKISKGILALYKLIAISTLTPLALSVGVLSLANISPFVFVVLGYLLFPLSMLAVSAFSLVMGQILPALLFGFMGVLMLFFMFNNKKRFSYSALLLTQTIAAMRAYPSTIIVSILSGITSALASILYLSSFSVIAMARSITDDASCPRSEGNDVCVSNSTMLITIYVVFVGYFLFEVIKNITHVTLSGIFGTWFFFGEVPSTSKPRNPALGAFKRATTYCFGSICFGSLIVSFVSTLHTCLTLIRAKLNSLLDFNNPGNDALICFALIIVRLLEWFAQELEYWTKWFNRFAYTYLAFYGKGYLQSAKDTFEIMKFKGIDLLITDSLIGSALGLYSLLVVLGTAATIWISAKATGLLEFMGYEMIAMAFVGSFLVAWFITSTVVDVLDVGSVCLMVGLAIEPDRFAAVEGRQAVWNELCRLTPEFSKRATRPWSSAFV
ncbi:Pns1 protein [Martiniozyma asiatica (nom. inval.)]|nr:Pns1 protein [Martiniozyma asiatica]